MWFHRSCAGVPLSHFKDLANSDKPFVCILCSQNVHQAVVCQLQSEIAELKTEQQAHTGTVHELQSMVRSLAEEVRELKATVTVLRSSPTTTSAVERAADDTRWSTVASRDKRPPQHVRKQQVQVSEPGEGPHAGTANPNLVGSRQSEKRQRWHSVQSLPAKHRKTQPTGPNSQPRERGTSPRHDTRRVIDGVRRVWGTMKSCTPKILLSTLQRVTTVAEHIEVRRKFKMKEKSEIRWWFLIRGEEPILQLLDKEWENVENSTSWRLERCHQPTTPPLSTDATGDTSTQVHDQPTTGLPQANESSTDN